MNLLFCTFILIILDIQFTITNEFTLLYIYINYIRLFNLQLQMNLLFCTFILIILDIQFTITNEFTLLYIYINYIRHSIYR